MPSRPRQTAGHWQTVKSGAIGKDVAVRSLERDALPRLADRQPFDLVGIIGVVLSSYSRVKASRMEDEKLL